MVVGAGALPLNTIALLLIINPDCLDPHFNGPYLQEWTALDEFLESFEREENGPLPLYVVGNGGYHDERNLRDLLPNSIKGDKVRIDPSLMDDPHCTGLSIV